MLPLVGLATALLPELVRLIAGDKAGAVATDVAKAVNAVTGTDDPVAAKAKLDADPVASADLQVKLAQIALEATKIQNEEEERKRQNALGELQARLQEENQKRKDQFTALQAQLQAEDQKRKDQLTELQARLQADIASTAGARSFQQDLARSGSPIMWAPPIVSVVVVVSFLIVVVLLAYPPAGAKFADNQLLNICVGALVAGFTTVISFWLGSSQGSREKDSINRALQNTQAEQTSEMIKAQTAALQTATTARGTQKPAGGAAAGTKGDNFEQCLQLVFGAEGGFGNDAADPGGPTKFGITLATLADWRKKRAAADKDKPVTIDDVRSLTREEATEIYRTNYWNVLRCGDLPSGIDLLVFDFGVNAGPGTSAMHLQKIVGVTQDGSIGPITIAALQTIPPRKLISEFSSRRLDYYRGLTELFARFGAGWTNRTRAMEEAAQAMAGA